MSIRPIGERIKVSQQIQSDTSQSLWDSVGEFEGQPESPLIGDAGQDSADLSIDDYFFNKMIEFGYPYRLIADRRDDITTQEVSTEGEQMLTVVNVSVTLPAIKYPVPGKKIQEITMKSIKEIAKEVKSKFLLRLKKAVKSGKEWNLEFVSTDPAEDERRRKEQNIDKGEMLLEEIYGKKKSAGFNNDSYWSKVSFVMKKDNKGEYK